MDPKLFAFVLMPFSASFDDIYKLGIKAAAEDCGILAERVDEQSFYTESMLERIYNQIHSCDFIIADLSEKNPNVFYEVGYAHAKEKVCVLLTSTASDIPFDLKHRRHIVYGGSISKLKRDLVRELGSIENEIKNRKMPITVEIGRTSGDLNVTKYNAEGVVEFYVDLFNKSKSLSPDIDLMYLYTGEGWRFTQDRQECLSANSDLQNFKTRHIIRPPIRRLNSGGWAQVKVTGTKTLAYSFRGEKLEDEYKVTGRVLVRVVASGQVYDFLQKIDVLCNDVPF